jgi:hypothetical protein
VTIPNETTGKGSMSEIITIIVIVVVILIILAFRTRNK